MLATRKMGFGAVTAADKTQRDLLTAARNLLYWNAKLQEISDAEIVQGTEHAQRVSRLVADAYVRLETATKAAGG